MKKFRYKKRDWELFFIYLMLALIFFAYFITLYNIFKIQILDKYNLTSSSTKKVKREIERGEIFFVDKFQKKYKAASNVNEYDVYAVPKNIENKKEFSKKVSELLNLNYNVILTRVSKKDDPYEPIKNGISEEVKAKIDSLNLEGIGYKIKKKRKYPNDNLASHLLGFVSLKKSKGVGQYGLEEFYDEELSGEKYQNLNKDNIKGDGLILNVDPNIQFKIEEELKRAIEKWEAKGGSIIVMNPKNGKILAMANYPDFNPNEYFKVKDISVFKNNAISSQYEPGSIFKPITMAIGIDLGVITPDTTYKDKGFVKLSGYTIRNYDGKAHGEKTMTNVLEKSLNTGTVFVVQQIEKEKYYKYVKKFGFGEKTGIDLSGEVSGNIRNLESKRDINYATASFGQGIAVTPIQMVQAISAIANGGYLIKPEVVDGIAYFDGSFLNIKPVIKRRVISKETAQKVQKMMVSVVENGFDKAKIKGYFVAGKTGTAQIPNQGKPGYSDETIHSFIGFAPAFDAKFVVLVKLDKPNARFASQTTTSVFKKIMSYLLSYYNVPPDYSEEKKL